VAFPGDVEVTATETNGQQSDDFNVMTARQPAPARGHVAQNDVLQRAGRWRFMRWAPVEVNGTQRRDDLILTVGPARLTR
jgi:uncharacterized protein